MKTITLNDYIQSELQKRGLNEFVDEQGQLIFFKEEHQFIRKVMAFDSDVQVIINELFTHLTLDDPQQDEHFKKNFLYRFINRQINRQTIESFQLELANVFLTQRYFINHLYQNLDYYVTGHTESTQKNKQVNDGETTTDNRQALATLPQSTVNLDVDDSVMETADDNTISRNKQRNKQATDGTTLSSSKNYQLDQLVQTGGILNEVFNEFDRKCFLQVY